MQDHADRLAWWREARFGMFIHWGLYSVPAGVWEDKEIPSLGEWIMRNARIPIAEYEKLAKRFKPVKFDADAWADLAVRAGMKYMVLTAKHHDGFCMFKSPAGYNLVEASPYGRDVVAELAQACARRGLKLGLYYSQAQDWHAPGGAGHWEEDRETPWWNPSVQPEAFARYLEEVVKPDLTALLTNYGPIALIWFDTPVVITQAQSRELGDLVHQLQPDCLVSGRVGHGQGDYGSLGDNEIPAGLVRGDWETPATFNDTWGYKRSDHNWKPADELLGLLCDLVSKGVNYLLNVGPDALGRIPQPSVTRLKKIGDWLRVNGPAVYGTQGSPFPYEFAWGRLTRKGERLFLLITDWREKIVLRGLRNRVKKAAFLAVPARRIELSETHDPAGDAHELILNLGKKRPDKPVTVVELTLDGAPDVDIRPMQQPDGTVCLLPHMAELHPAADNPKFGLSPAGQVVNWTKTDSWLEWRFRLNEPGEYAISVVTGGPGHDQRHQVPQAGQQVSLKLDGKVVRGSIQPGERLAGARTEYHPEYATAMGRLKLEKAGWLTAEIRAEAIPAEAWGGLPLASVRLTRI